ncbi:MAG: hypothetical protein OHK0015_32420 [Chloroflexi bacterium OHK40]|jgi:hypothetical protein
MLNGLALILVGLLPLFLGRRLFWLFVGVAGFLFGLTLAQAGMGEAPGWMQLLVGVLVGLVCGGLAVIFTRPMAMLGGFFALSSLGVAIGVWLDAPGWMFWLLFIVFGLIGVLLVALLFDWAIIIASAANGAAAVVTGLAVFVPMPGWLRLLLMAIVFAIGALYQARDMETGGGFAQGVPVERRS